MAVEARGKNTYRIRISLGRVNGAQKFYRETFHGLKIGPNGVLARERELKTKKATRSALIPSRTKLSVYLAYWLETLTGKVSNRTRQDYIDYVRRYVDPILGHVEVGSITPLHIETMHLAMKKKGLSSRTIIYAHTILSAALSQAERWKLLLGSNPAKLVKRPRLEPTLAIHPMTAEEVAAFLNEARGHKWEALFALALDSGMRPGEYFGLKWEYLDLKTRIVRVEQTLVWARKGGWTLESPKTRRSRRSILLASNTIELLAKHLRSQNEEQPQHGRGYKYQGFVFANPNGGPLEHSSFVRRQFKPLLKEAGLDPTRFHLYCLRHTTATLMFLRNSSGEGQDAGIVSRRLGHARTGFTQDVYAHVLPSMERAASDHLSQILYGDRHQNEGSEV